MNTQPYVKYCSSCDTTRPSFMFYAFKYKGVNKHLSTYCRPCQNHNRTKNRLMVEYGITVEERDAMLSAQDHKCDICGIHIDDTARKTLAVDHDHNTGNVRGMLCLNCNIGIGYLQDSPDVLEKAIAYLKKHERSGQS